MSAPLSLRRYRPEDHARVLELYETAMRAVDAYVEGVPEPDLDDTESAYLDDDGESLVGSLRTSHGRHGVVPRGFRRPTDSRIPSSLAGRPYSKIL
ncbi:MAG: hypothetical protein V5A55_13455 [Halovenus sp.]